MSMNNCKKLNFKIRKQGVWMIDYDYLSQLSEEELQWLAEFTQDFYGKPQSSTDEERKEFYKDDYKIRWDVLNRFPEEFDDF